MSKASSRADARAESWIERRQHPIAVLASALLHVLFVLLALWSSRIPMTPPQGADAGGRMAVDFIGETTPPPVRKAVVSKPAARPATSRVQSTQVADAEDPVPPVVPETALQEPAEAPAETAPAAPPAPTAPQRRSRNWGRPPGLLEQDVAPQNRGLGRSPSPARGRGNDSASGPSLDVGGYQVYYNQRSEARLREWRDQGMTEIFLPLPGTRQLMACPLETALKRESGPCRLLEPDSPDLAKIGDAREVIDMQKVFRLGEAVWTGPGPYR